MPIPFHISTIRGVTSRFNSFERSFCVMVMIVRQLEDNNKLRCECLGHCRPYSHPRMKDSWELHRRCMRVRRPNANDNHCPSSIPFARIRGPRLDNSNTSYRYWYYLSYYKQARPNARSRYLAT
jgi:hypothetical protein